jgi:hypothetical protein
VDSDGAIWWAVSFSSLGEIPSGPVALLTSSVRRQTKTSSGERFNSDVVGSHWVVGGRVVESIRSSFLFKTEVK